MRRRGWRLTGEVERINMLVMRLSIVTNVRVMIICIRAFKVQTPCIYIFCQMKEAN